MTAPEIGQFLADMDRIENDFLNRDHGFRKIHVDREMFEDLLDFVDDLCERGDDATEIG